MIVSTKNHPRVAPCAALAAIAVLASVLASPIAARAQIQSETLIQLTDGAVQGQLNENTREFLGIPYAAPPVGPLRWRPPTPNAPWAGTLDATQYSSPCPQLAALAGTPSENEDCLYLNVWTPEPAALVAEDSWLVRAAEVYRQLDAFARERRAA